MMTRWIADDDGQTDGVQQQQTINCEEFPAKLSGCYGENDGDFTCCANKFAAPSKPLSFVWLAEIKAYHHHN